MNAAQLRKVKRGDVLKCNMNGRTFYAHAGTLDKRDGENGITIEPIPGKGSAITSRWVSDGDITGHWAKGWDRSSSNA